MPAILEDLQLDGMLVDQEREDDELGFSIVGEGAGIALGAIRRALKPDSRI